MELQTDLPLERVDRKLRSFGYEPCQDVTGCFYRNGIFQLEIIADGKGKLTIVYPLTVDGCPHPLEAHISEFLPL